MINITEVKVYMTRKNRNAKELAKIIGVSPATLSRWFDSGDMPTSAAEKIITELQIPIEDQTAIFFANNVACQATRA